MSTINSITNLNRQRGAIKTKINKIQKFLEEHSTQQDASPAAIILKKKLKVAMKLQASISELIKGYTLLPEEIDLKDNLDVAQDIEDEIEEIEFYLFTLIDTVLCCHVLVTVGAKGLTKIDSELERLFKVEEFEAEFSKSEEYRQKVVRTKIRATKRINEQKQKLTTNSASVNETSSLDSESVCEFKSNDYLRVKLPKMTINKFYGDVNNWLTFWNSYESAIHNNKCLDKVEKFHYLKAHLSGTALSSIEGLPISDTTYDTAIDLLKNRFAKTDLLIHTHMNNILNIKPLRNSNDVFAFRKFYDKINIELRSLENLGQSIKDLSSVLCTTILKSLPRDILIQMDKTTNESAYNDINTLLTFLSDILHIRERAEIIKNNTNELVVNQPLPSRKFETNRRHIDSIGSSKTKYQQKSYDKKEKNIFSTSELISTNVKDKTFCCFFCENKKGDILHDSKDCSFAMTLSNEKKVALLKKKGICFRCLQNRHVASKCVSKVTCNYCGFRHVSIMCYKNKNADDKTETQDSEKVLSNQIKYSPVFLQTLIVGIKGGDLKGYCRLLIDTGSQNSYISQYAAKRLKLKKINSEVVKHGLFGGVEKSELHNRYQLNISSFEGNFSFDIEVLDEKKICSSVPRVQDENLIGLLRNKGIILSDIQENENRCLFQDSPDEIHILLGADNVAQLFTERIEHFPDIGIAAFETKIGWTLMGKRSDTDISDSTFSGLSLSLHVSDAKLSELWRLDTIGISSEENKTKSMLEEETQKHFLETVKRDNTGRYEVSLPWITDSSVLPSNRFIAEKSLFKTETKLVNSNKKKDYEEIFDYWETNKIIEVVNDEKEERVHFLAHRPVFKESSETTKTRPVFNASAREKDPSSRNDCLAKGPNLIEIVPSILNRFRKYKVGLSSDIEKAFCQIKIADKDRDFLRFLWFDSDKNLKIYRHNRVVFGLTSSPFLLAATLNHLLNAVPGHLSETSRILKDSFYIDNSLVSLDQIEETEKFISEAKEILSSAHFNLRCWRSNMSVPMIDSTESKPQFTWIQKIKWDQQLPPNLSKQFSTWIKKLDLLPKIGIPRWLNIDYQNEYTTTLHIFTDASKQAFATCAFLRTENKGVHVQLVNARSRVAPIKEITIPRLELLSCLIGARLAKTILTDLRLEYCRTIFWSDSSTALGWIRRDQTWGTFVHNRVQEIRTSTKISDWKHVPGKYNPADLPSRGCSFEQLLESRWWEGPIWLYLPEKEWPHAEEQPDEDVLNKEKRKTVLSLLDKEHKPDWYYHYFSSYRKIVRMIAWILRLLYNCRNSEKNLSSELSVDELEKAERRLFKLIQKESFTGTQDPSIKALRPIEDENGLFRAKTSIIQRKDEKNFLYPVILPSSHPVVQRLILEKHLEKHHAGVSMLMAHLKENVWILKSRKTIRNVIRKCIKCKRFQAHRIEIEPGIPPEDRVKEAAIFEIIGVDLAGPLYLSNKSKAWIVLYTCAVYRAIHLELVTSLSTETFLLSLRRFISRRVRPYVIYCDNGTSFVGANKLLEKLNWKEISAATSAQKIRFKFNPPTAAWWERLVRMVKEILRKVLGRTSLNYEELNTILCDCEQVINSRPITYVSEDNKDPSPLTPMMFLQDLPSSGVPDIDNIDSKGLNKRAKYRQGIRDDLRRRCRIEYLGQLRYQASRVNKIDQLTVGDVVLIEDINKRRIHWPLTKIIELLPGKDKVVRLAKVKTENGTFLRPLQRLFPLEISEPNTNPFLFPASSFTDSPSSSSESMQPAASVSRALPYVSRYGRTIRPIEK
ncbi:uncharacterized protein [Parasteatoda tepidariorum]|uniref:uncharacterized protein n=1 Tax=Parasteatoda tepidariorum TaxID=114398 RepID=UPI0039BCD07B